MAFPSLIWLSKNKNAQTTLMEKIHYNILVLSSDYFMYIKVNLSQILTSQVDSVFFPLYNIFMKNKLVGADDFYLLLTFLI